MQQSNLSVYFTISLGYYGDVTLLLWRCNTVTPQCRGWRYIRTKNSGTQSTLSMVNKGDAKQVIDLTTNNNASPPPGP